jgi:hypothetical protein
MSSCGINIPFLSLTCLLPLLHRFREMRTVVGSKWLWSGVFDPVGPHSSNARFVAMKKKAIGMGSERYAFQFYEVGNDGRSIVGKPFIAKQSCYILENQGDESSCSKFATTFCEKQHFTRRIAMIFNEKLDRLARINPKTPRINVLDCSIYHLNQPGEGKMSVLVEPRLDHMKWMKWNM